MTRLIAFTYPSFIRYRRMINGGAKGLLNGQMLLRPSRCSEGIISRTCRQIWGFMISASRKPEPPKLRWPGSMELRDSVTGIIGSQENGCSRDHFVKC